MSKINDGGPAFPNVPDGAGDKWSDWDHGMTLRDYFAAHAPTPAEEMDIADHCAYRYRYADAMLAAREKGGA